MVGDCDARGLSRSGTAVLAFLDDACLQGVRALEAGAFVVLPVLFDVLHRLLGESMYCTLAEAMNVIASEGKLRFSTVDGVDWFGEQTVRRTITSPRGCACSLCAPS